MLIFYNNEKETTKMINLEDDSDLVIYPFWIHHVGEGYALVITDYKNIEDHIIGRYYRYTQASQMMRRIKQAFYNLEDSFFMSPFSQNFLVP